MIRLAEEMSLQERKDQDSYEYKWDPNNLDAMRMKLRVYEEILHGIDCATPEFQNEDGAPVMTDEELREMFFSAGVSEEEIRLSSASVGMGRSSGRKDQKTHDTVAMICRGLTWYRNKLVDEIQSSHEPVTLMRCLLVAEQHADLTGLLDMQEYVNILLERADVIVSNNFSRVSTPTSAPLAGIIGGTIAGTLAAAAGGSVALAPPFATGRANSSSGKQQTNSNNNSSSSNIGGLPVPSFVPSVVSAVYAVKRSNHREEIAKAVDNLTKLCNLGNDVNLTTIKQMTTAGALQALLTLLPKTHDWPEIESQIFKIVSMLVSYEEDWALLQRSAMVILTSLYTLQLKSQSRARTRSIPPMMMSSGAPTVLTTAPVDEAQQLDHERQQGLLIRELVSAAIDKLSLVLSSEWSQQSSLIGNLPFLNVSAAKNPVSAHLKRSAGAGSSGGASNAAGNNNDRAREADAILQIMLNLIIFIWENATSGDGAGGSTYNINGGGTLLTSLKLLLLGYRDESSAPGNGTGASGSLPTPLRSLNNSTVPSRQHSEDPAQLLQSLGGGNQPPVAPSSSSASSSSSEASPAAAEKPTATSNIDEFLQRVFHVTLDQLLHGDCAQIRHQLVDNSAVLCSAALANLAEIPQCRPGLVARGAVKLIKSWLDVSMMMLEVARRIVFEHLADVLNHSHFYEAFFKMFGPSYELLANATEALMFLAGGTNHAGHATLSTSTGGRDYIIGWVDAQILAEELPDLMVKLVLATFETNLADRPFDLRDAKDAAASSSKRRPRPTTAPRTRSVLPLKVSLNVATTLYQLCSRRQNRHTLHGITIPYVLCVIFEHAFGYVPEVMGFSLDSPRKSRRGGGGGGGGGYDDDSDASIQTHDDHSDGGDGDGDGSTRTEEEDPIFLQIFEFGKAAFVPPPDVQASSGFAEPLASSHGPGSPGPLGGFFPERRTSSSSATSQHHDAHAPLLRGRAASRSRLSYTARLSTSQLHFLQAPTPTPHAADVTAAAMLAVLSSVAAAALDALGIFLADEDSQQRYPSNVPSAAASVGGGPGYYTVPVDVTTLHLVTSGAASGASSTTGASAVVPQLTLLELLEHPRVMAALLAATSHLGKGSGRLSCVRLISSLTEWPTTLKALYEGSVMDTLLVIIYEAEGDSALAAAATNSSTKSLHGGGHGAAVSGSAREAPASEDFPFSFFAGSGRGLPAKPSAVERNVSGNSSISGMSSSVASTAFHVRSNGLHGGDADLAALEDDANSTVVREKELLQEETMCVCCALANLCVAEHAYALRMFNSGLVTLMTRLVRNMHFETSLQALRCMHAMTRVVVAEAEALSPSHRHGTGGGGGGLSHSTSQRNMTTTGSAKAIANGGSGANGGNATSAATSAAMRAAKFAELFASLETVMATLSSHSVLIQIEAVRTIAQLVLIGEEFQDRIVDECLLQIVRLLVNPGSDRELRSAAEEVLKNLGFSAGYKDFEICGFDFELLRDWYAIQRSMKPQETSMLILRDWLQRLFPSADDVAHSGGDSHQRFLRAGGSFSAGSLAAGEGSASGANGGGNGSGSNLAAILANGGPSSPYHGPDATRGGEFHLLQETAAILHTQVDATSTMPAYLLKDHHVGGAANAASGANSAHSSSGSQSAKSLTGGMGIPHLHRHLTDSLLKFWPFCAPPKPLSGSGATSATGDFHSDDFHDAGRSKSRDSPFQAQHMQRTATPVSSASTPTASYPAAGANSGFFASQPTVIPAATQSLLNTVAVSLSGAIASAAATSTTATGGTDGSSGAAVSYDWPDKPPAIVIHLLDLFYTSRIHQLVLMDLTSLGASIAMSPPGGGNGHGHGNGADEDGGAYRAIYSFLMPAPHPIKAVLLPPRVYTSFNRVGRVLQRMLEYNQQLVSLTFRDCYFEGEFHTTLLETLQKCPAIVSLTFANALAVEEDALLGHLVGQLPSTVRFVSFKGSLSRPSVETLCVMLSNGGNAAFVPLGDPHVDDFFVPHAAPKPTSLHRHASARSHDEHDGPSGGGSSGSGAKKKKRDSHTQPSQQQPQPPQRNKFEVLSRGLLGLALTHLSLDASCLQKVAEMLNPKGNPARSALFSPLGHGGTIGLSRRSDSNPSLVGGASNGSNTPSSPPPHGAASSAPGLGGFFGHKKGSSAESSGSATPSNSNGAGGALKRAGTPSSFRASESSDSGAAASGAAYLPGLRYLDLSHNDLHDAQCAQLIAAAVKGPLEGLELGGNHIHFGNRFVEAMQDFHPERLLKQPNRLRYLGLSQNQLQVHAVARLFAILRHNVTVTSLDLSANGLDGSNPALNEALYELLRHNAGLRVLNLSYNRLHTDTYRKIQLGVLQNTTLLMLPLDGNPRAEIDRSLTIVQDKLRKNRALYKTCSINGYTVLARPPAPAHGHSGHTPDAAPQPPVHFYQPEDLRKVLQLQQVGAAGAAAAVASPTVTVQTTLPNGPPRRLRRGAARSVSRRRCLAPSGGQAPYPAHTNPLNKPTPPPRHRATERRALPAQRRRRGPRRPGGAGEPGRPLLVGAVGGADLDGLRAARPLLSPAVGVVAPGDLVDAALAKDLAAQTVAIAGGGAASGSGASSAAAAASSSAAVAAAAAGGVYRSNTLHVLFSAPLAGYDRQGKAHPMEVLDYAAERDALMQVFKEARRDVALHFDFATTNTLRTILSFGGRALHFSGHGLPNGLCFEDGRSGLQIVGATQLKDLLGAGGLSLKFVFVSACYSREIGEAFVRAGVSHVVCVKIDSKIQDSAAMAFTRAFYIAFLSGRSVAASFAIAKEALKASPYVPNSVVEGEKFVLLPEASASSAASTAAASTAHDEVIFSGANLVVDWPQPAAMCTIGANRVDVRTFQYYQSRLPRPPTDFEGREVQMNGLVRHLLDRRLVSLVGEDGMGKSAVAAAVCRYMADRELFRHAIVYVKGKGIRDFASFLWKLKQELVYCGFLAPPASAHVPHGHHAAHAAHAAHVPQPPPLPPLPPTVTGDDAAAAVPAAAVGVDAAGDAAAAHGAASLASQPQPQPTTMTSSDAATVEAVAVVGGATHATHPPRATQFTPSPPTVSGSGGGAAADTVLEEDTIFACLRELHVLLVFDSLDALLGDYRGAVTDLRLFFHRLFDECAAVKVLNVGVDTLMFHNINMATANAVEYSVNLGPLTIASTLRLFARLAPSLYTAQEKQAFIASLLPPKQAHCSVQSREANKCTLAILRLFGDGHPARIVHLACESTAESVDRLLRDGVRLRRQYEPSTAVTVTTPRSVSAAAAAGAASDGGHHSATSSASASVASAATAPHVVLAPPSAAAATSSIMADLAAFSIVPSASPVFVLAAPPTVTAATVASVTGAPTVVVAGGSSATASPQLPPSLHNP
eukprot:gene4826-3460_t